MDWTAHLDEYCERTTSMFWGEPLNAVSNISYILAAIALWRMLRNEPRVPVSIGFLPVMAAIVGIGSFTFHTVATGWAKTLDVVPIAIFVLWYWASFQRWFYRLSWTRALLGVGAFVVVVIAFLLLANNLIPNRSGPYVPVLALLVGLAVAMGLSRRPDRRRHTRAFSAAAATFAVALAARSADEEVCSSFPIGLHLFWHLLTGLLLFLVGRPLILHWRDVSASPSATDAVAAGTPSR